MRACVGRKRRFNPPSRNSSAVLDARPVGLRSRGVRVETLPSPPSGGEGHGEGGSVGLKRVKPRKRHPAADHHLNQGGREKHEPKSATRRQKPREEERSREQWRGENPE